MPAVVTTGRDGVRCRDARRGSRAAPEGGAWRRRVRQYDSVIEGTRPFGEPFVGTRGELSMGADIW